MEVIFGVQARDGTLRVQIPDDGAAAIKAEIEAAFNGGANRLLWVTDKDGKEYGIPTDKIAYVEFASEKAARTVGFSN